MRIFYAAQSTPNETALPSSKLWYVNLYLPLVDSGHTIVPYQNAYLAMGYDLDPSRAEDCQIISRYRPQFSEELWDQLLKAHRKTPIDLFFSYFSSAHVEASVIRQIRDLGITTVNWYCNASYQFHLVKDIAPAYDYCLVPEKFRLEDYRRIGANPIYCQEAANPNIYKPYDLPTTFDVTFVGQKYGNRPEAIRRLIDAGIDARTWGPHWQTPASHPPLWRRAARIIKHGLRNAVPRDVPFDHCGPPLSDEEYVQMYSRSKISLGFSTVAQLPRPGEQAIKQVRLRDFEAPMSGAFYMVEFFEELTEFFEPDREIVFFTDLDDLVDKAHYYLSHPEERERIRQAGMRRARTEHTWHKRFETVFKQIGLK